MCYKIVELELYSPLSLSDWMMNFQWKFLFEQ